MRSRIAALPLLAVAALSWACAERSSPLQQLVQQLQGQPEYSIVLEDMREEGNFFSEYSHRYKVVEGMPSATDAAEDLSFESWTTDWERVSRREYERFQPYLGMVIASKSREGADTQAAGYPPGYQYIGDPRYGNWKQDSSGNSFWEFAGKYAVLSAIFNMGNRPIYRNDWDDYRSYRRSGRPYFGPSRQYGTDGSFTQKTHPGFFQRRLQKQRQAQRRFSSRVGSRVSRSRMSGARSRSRGFGK